MTTGFYLLDHPNPHAARHHDGQYHGYPSRRGQLRVGVVHTAENLPDFAPPDTGAESVAQYGASTPRQASWHDTVDSDSRIPMLPWDHVAWHVGGFNTPSVGLEIATRAAAWDQVPEVWRGAIMLNAADVVREWREVAGIPTRLITAHAARAGEWGIIGHAPLDPTRRSDPGAGFSWPTLIYLATRDEPAPLPPTPPEVPMAGRVHIGTDVVELRRGARGVHVRKLQHMLNEVAGQGLKVDGDYGKNTERAVVNFQTFLGLPDARGVASAWTWHMLVTLPI